MYNNNPYFNNTPYYNPYAQTYQPTAYTRQTMAQTQPVAQQSTMQSPNNLPFTDIRYATEEQAKNFIVQPNNTILFINMENSEFYISSTDMMGKTSFEPYSFNKKVIETQTNASPVNINDLTKDFVKFTDIDGLATKDDLKGLLTANDIQGLNERISALEKNIKINAILSGSEQTNANTNINTNMNKEV